MSPEFKSIDLKNKSVSYSFRRIKKPYGQNSEINYFKKKEVEENVWYLVQPINAAVNCRYTNI